MSHREPSSWNSIDLRTAQNSHCCVLCCSGMWCVENKACTRYSSMHIFWRSGTCDDKGMRVRWIEATQAVSSAVVTGEVVEQSMNRVHAFSECKSPIFCRSYIAMWKAWLLQCTFPALMFLMSFSRSCVFTPFGRDIHVTAALWNILRVNAQSAHACIELLISTRSGHSS